MGNTLCGITEEELTEYEELTFLTKREILHAWSRWKELVGESSNSSFSDKQKGFPSDTVLQLPELQHNPFKDRIARHFSDAATGQSNRPVSTGANYNINFDNFIDLLHVMSPRAPLQLKAHYAFKIFDMNEDTILDKEDLTEVVMRLTDENLETDKIDKLVTKLLEETDLEGDGAISEEEFKHLLNKCPDFTLSFRFTL